MSTFSTVIAAVSPLTLSRTSARSFPSSSTRAALKGNFHGCYPVLRTCIGMPEPPEVEVQASGKGIFSYKGLDHTRVFRGFYVGDCSDQVIRVIKAVRNNWHGSSPGIKGKSPRCRRKQVKHSAQP